MPRGRTYSREFKLAVVQEVEAGARRPVQVCREHGLANSVLARWRQEYVARGEAAFMPPAPESAEALARRVAELERFCGQLALENQVLKKGLSLAASRSGER